MFKIKYFIQQSWLLIVASFCFGLLIAVTNSAWSPKILQNEKDKLNDLMRGLISNAGDFQMVMEGLEIPAGKGRVAKTDVYKALDNNGRSIGFAFVAEGAGFADKIKLVIAVDSKCEKFFGYEVLSSNETPGFGSKIKEDYFANQFSQAPAGKVELVKTGNAREIDSKIVAISGATVSSEAVVKIFNTYIDRVKEQLQVKGLVK
jgi:electron transport complex protein RnfG